MCTRGFPRPGQAIRLAGIAIGLTLTLTHGVSAQNGATAELDALFDEPPFDGMHVGALVVDLDTGETLYTRNPAQRFAPASNQKLLTTLSALQRLGPDYRFHTTLESAARLGEAGVLVGDLLVRSHGDPTLSERFHDSAEAPLAALVDELWAHGVRRIRGDLVVDAIGFDSTRIVGTWMWGDLPFGYAAVGAPFAVSEGMAEVEAHAGAVGEPVSLRWWPLGAPDRFTSSARSVTPSDSADLSARVREGRKGVEVTGELSAFTLDTLQLSVQDPTAEAAAVLLRLLGDRGIIVDGSFRVMRQAPPCPGADPCPDARVLASLESPPLMEIVQGVLEPSQNWMADQLLRHLGAVAGGEAGWPDGIREMRRVLQTDFGVDSLDLTIRDGSGLSAYNLVTPRAVIALLREAHQRPWGTAFRAALAEPGEEDSTLERRLDGLEGRVFAKTGTITHVNSLSGYLDTDGGRHLAFAFLTNASGLGSSQVRRRVDQAVRLLAESY